MRQLLIVFLVLISLAAIPAEQEKTMSVVRIKYDGGGDWYGNKTTFINLFKNIRDAAKISTDTREQVAAIEDEGFFNFPIAYIAGHGNVKFSEAEASRLRTYLTSGGFLFADDDYGMDKSFRRQMNKVFPELKFVEIPFSHPIYHQFYDFPNGLPKIHEHDGGPPRGLGLIYEGRLVVFYSMNTDISDGCENPEIHNDPPAKREAAIKMGTNILLYALMH